MRKLFVENFRGTTTHQSILELFQTKGKVDSVTVHTDRHGVGLSYAFVEMENDREASNAICSLNNSVWNGSRLTVTAAVHSAEHTAGFSGGSCVLQRKQK